MRILAVRGSNLASLAGRFELRLDCEPLGDAGLFAITGKTGAGKSTILDAMCLALYDKMPRMPGGNGTLIGRSDESPGKQLRNNDVRSILRRGAGEGFAEVEFRGMDGRAYRARWTVRRARGKADGRFQPQSMEFWDLTAEKNLSGGKKEVLAHIEQRLGLTFEQFRRSVMLAQGDFAAFLRAVPRERADLLERITGTDIYGRLSEAAHRRWRDEDDKLKLIEQRLGDQNPLDSEARAVLESELAAATTRLDERSAQQQRLQKAKAWYDALERLEQERRQAEKQWQDAQTDFDAAEPRRAALLRIQRLQPLRIALNERDKAIAAHADGRQKQETLFTEKQRLQAQQDEAGAAAQLAQGEYDKAEQARREAMPLLQQARTLDARIQDATALLTRLQQDRQIAETAQISAQKAHRDLDEQQKAAAKTLAETSDWLAARADWQPLVAQWEAWERELARFASAQKQQQDALERRKTSISRSAKLNAQRQRQAAQDEKTLAELQEAEAQSRKLETRLAGFDLGSLARQRESLGLQQQKVGDWRRLVEQFNETQGSLDKHQQALALEQSAQQARQTRLAELAESIPPLQGALDEAEAQHRRLIVASADKLDSLRQQLQEGEACPLCGAEEHPWAHQQLDVLQGLAGEQAGRLAQIKGELDKLNDETSRRKAEQEQSQRRASELIAEIDEGQARLIALRELWESSAADELHPKNPFAPGLAERLVAAAAELTEAQQGIAQNEEQARTLMADNKIQQTAIKRLDERLKKARERLAEFDKQLDQTKQEQDQADRQHALAEETQAQIEALLAPPFSHIENWSERLRADLALFTTECRDVVAEYRQSEKQSEATRQLQQTLAPRLAEASAHLGAAQQTLAQHAGDLVEQQAALRRLQEQRAPLFEGRAADVVETALEQVLARSREGRETARKRRDEVAQAMSSLDGALSSQIEILSSQQAAAQQAESELEALLREHQVTLAQLRDILAHEQQWVEQERLALEQIEEARQAAFGLLQERTRKCAEQRAAEPPEWPLQTVLDGLRNIAAELNEAREAWAGLHGRQSEDERRKLAVKSLQAELDQQRERQQIWASLNQLIGSADGAKFRSFAQGLTLELLVEHANVHLQDLARRYLLQRAPGSEMELQVVDREMGDEVRGVHSLSGGESFLLSLALALGLASLASDRVQVESLFIDEGFGALDADSLDMAIASLDALYSLGRQVGVISHVGALVERIGIKVEVAKQGGGRSRLAVLAG